MADVQSVTESDWGPEQTQVPPVGSIFILRLYGNQPMPPVVDKTHRYQLIGLVGKEMDLHLWDDYNKEWNVGHSWTVREGVAFRVLLGTAQTSVASAVSGCHCSKCNNHFPFAEPNQADGTLICWNCRNYPYFKGRLG